MTPARHPWSRGHRRPAAHIEPFPDLVVTFPGLTPTRLTGPRFSVGICPLKGCLTRRAERPAFGS